MKPFILRGILNKNETNQLWSQSVARSSSEKKSTGVLDVTRDPSIYIDILRKRYSPSLSKSELEGLYARAWKDRSSGTCRWWANWIFETPALQAFIGRPVTLAEETSPTVFGATFIWVGIPCPSTKPSVEDISSTERTRFFSKHMVSLLSFHHPDATQKYIWCTINCDGDTIPLDSDFLRVLLETEIAELKTYVKRTGNRRVIEDSMAATSKSTGRDAFLNAAKMMTIRFDGVDPLSSTFVPVPIPDPKAPVPASFAPMAIPSVPNRAKVMDVTHKSIAKKRKASGSIPNPYLADAENEEEKERMRQFLCYFLHYGIYEPAVKEALGKSPHDGAIKQIAKDPAFVQYMQVVGNLFITQDDDDN